MLPHPIRLVPSHPLYYHRPQSGSTPWLLHQYVWQRISILGAKLARISKFFASEYPPISVRQISLLVDREFDLCAKRETIPVTLANTHPMLRFQDACHIIVLPCDFFIRHNLTAVTRISLNARSTVVNKTTYLNHEGIYKKTREWISVTVGTKRRFPNLEMNDLHDVLSLRI